MGTKVVVDLLDQCAHVGELHHALEAGLLTEESVHGEIGPVVAGQIPGRTNDQEITVFDAIRTALQDTAAAVLAYERAVQKGVGLQVYLARQGWPRSQRSSWPCEAPRSALHRPVTRGQSCPRTRDMSAENKAKSGCVHSMR